MTKNEYLLQLKTELKKKHIADAEDIVLEYEQHFTFKLADGFTQEEIAAKLGSPKELADQFENDGAGNPSSLKTIKKALSLIAIPFEVLGFMLFFAWIVVIAAACVAAFAIGICLVAQMNYMGWIPVMPHLSAIFFGICFFALAVLLGGAVYYCSAFWKQTIKAQVRWHRNLFSGRIHPPHTTGLQFEIKAKRRLRRVIHWVLAIFGITFILAYIVAAIQAGSFEFWHIWHWFM